MILAIHLLVAPMLNVRTEYAHAYRSTKVIRTQCAVLNASLTMIVLETSRVSETNVSIHVLDLVVKTQFVM
jgi:hypothetical protein